MLLIERVKKGATFTAEEVLVDKITDLMVRLYDLRYLKNTEDIQEISDSLHKDSVAIRNSLETWIPKK